jgi:hypothetical protein
MLRFGSGRSASAVQFGWYRAAHGAGQHSIGDDVPPFAVQPDGDSPDQRRSARHEAAGQVDRAVAVDHPVHPTGPDPASRAGTAVTGGGCAGCGRPPTRCSPSASTKSPNPSCNPHQLKEVKGTQTAQPARLPPSCAQKLSRIN